MSTNKKASVIVIATAKAPYHKAGLEYSMNAETAEKMISMGWGEYPSEKGDTHTASSTSDTATAAKETISNKTTKKTTKKK